MPILSLNIIHHHLSTNICPCSACVDKFGSAVSSCRGFRLHLSRANQVTRSWWRVYLDEVRHHPPSLSSSLRLGGVLITPSKWSLFYTLIGEVPSAVPSAGLVTVNCGWIFMVCVCRIEVVICTLQCSTDIVWRRSDFS